MRHDSLALLLLFYPTLGFLHLSSITQSIMMVGSRCVMAALLLATVAYSMPTAIVSLDVGQAVSISPCVWCTVLHPTRVRFVCEW